MLKSGMGKGSHRVVNPRLKFEIATPNKKTVSKLVEDTIILNGKTVIVDIGYSNPLFLNLLSFYLEKICYIPYSHPNLYLPTPTPFIFAIPNSLRLVTLSIFPTHHSCFPSTHIAYHIHIIPPVPIPSIPRGD